jgi:transposase
VACAASRRWPLATASYHQTAKRLGKQRGEKIARVEVARRLAEAIWHVLTRNRPFAPAGRPEFLAA